MDEWATTWQHTWWNTLPHWHQQTFRSENKHTSLETSHIKWCCATGIQCGGKPLLSQTTVWRSTEKRFDCIEQCSLILDHRRIIFAGAAHDMLKNKCYWGIQLVRTHSLEHGIIWILSDAQETKYHSVRSEHWFIKRVDYHINAKSMPNHDATFEVSSQWDLLEHPPLNECSMYGSQLQLRSVDLDQFTSGSQNHVTIIYSIGILMYNIHMDVIWQGRH
jgi:hypothetical protein